MKILCDAVPFGFGPIGKLLAISPFLPKDWSLSLLASGTSYTLASKSPFGGVIQCDTENWPELEEKRNLFLDADLFVNVMNPLSVKFAKQIGTPVAEIDSLFWMWDDVPDYLLDVDVYYIQNFSGVKSQLERYKPRTHLLVGPIVDARFVSTSKSNQLLVHLGGMKSKLITPGENSPYPQLIGTLLTKALQEHQFDKVIVAGNEECIRASINYWNISRCTFTVLSHERFLDELARSSLALISPGLTATYEAFFYNTPIIFLPPQNFSQFHILKHLRDSDAAQFSIHWTDFYPEMNIPPSLPEADGVSRVLSCIARFYEDEAAQSRAGKYLSDALSNKNWEAVCLQQQQLLDALGGNGALTIASHLERVMNF